MVVFFNFLRDCTNCGWYLDQRRMIFVGIIWVNKGEITNKQ